MSIVRIPNFDELREFFRRGGFPELCEREFFDVDNDRLKEILGHLQIQKKESIARGTYNEAKILARAVYRIAAPEYQLATAPVLPMASPADARIHQGNERLAALVKHFREREVKDAEAASKEAELATSRNDELHNRLDCIVDTLEAGSKTFTQDVGVLTDTVVVELNRRQKALDLTISSEAYSLRNTLQIISSESKAQGESFRKFLLKLAIPFGIILLALTFFAARGHAQSEYVGIVRFGYGPGGTLDSTFLTGSSINVTCIGGCASGSTQDVNIIKWAGITLGSATNYGTSPGAVKVPGVNAFITDPLPAGTNVIGHVILDTGSTTAVTQATGSNLHMVVDSGTVTTVGAVTAITNALPSGTNVIGHVIVDSGIVTTVGTVTNLSQIATVVPTFGDVNNVASIAGMLNVTPVGRYNSTQPTLTDGRWNMFQLDSKGSLTIAKGSNGFSIDNTAFSATQGTSPWVVSVPTWAGGTLGAMANYGTSPGAVLVPGVNAFITNAPNITTVTTVTTANLAAETTKVIGTVRVQGNVGGVFDIAPGNTVPANVLMHGAKAVSAEQTAVTTGQAQWLITDLVGKLITVPYANTENEVHGTTAAITDTTSTSVIASAGGSLRNYVTDCTVSNSHATVSTFVKILEGSNIIWECQAQAAGGGCVATFPMPRRSAAATAINCQPVTTGANVICSCGGYKGL